MNITELMIGDIVQCTDGEQCIITNVRKIDGQSGIVSLKQSNGHVFNAVIGFISPAPLIAEFLEANGFARATEPKENWKADYYLPRSNRNDPFVTVMFWNDGGIVIKIETEAKTCNGINSVHNCDTTSIHQFQHLLKDCGINIKLTLP